MGASTRENTRVGDVQIRNDVVFWNEPGNIDCEVVAAKYLHTTKHPRSADTHEWLLELADGSSVQWTHDTGRYNAVSTGMYLAALPDERPVKKPPERFSFGIDPAEIAETLLRIGNGVNNKTAIVQSAIQMEMNTIEDFQFNVLTIVYAEKK